MNIKGIKLFALFVASISLTMMFQNCGKSTAKTSSSDNGGLQVTVTPDGTGGDGSGGDGTGGDGTGGDGGTNTEFSFDMSRGDSIYYADGGGMSPDFRSLRVLQKSFYVLAESHIYEQNGTTYNPDLPTSYCKDSALPHCNHLNTMNCLGEGCPTNKPVACHWESRLSQAEINNTFAAINNLVFLTKTINSSEPQALDCDNPNLSFYSDVVNDVHVSMAQKMCVPEGKYYVSSGGDGLKDIFENELDAVESAGAQCNNYASYHWQNTKFTYSAQSGFTPPLQRSFREVSYQNQSYSMRWKNSGDMTVYCANNVNFNQYDAFFPSSGLEYRIDRPNAIVADAPTVQVTYEDPVDNGRVREFYLSSMTSSTHGGGAILDSNQAQAMQSAVEALINRADAFQATTTNCP